MTTFSGLLGLGLLGATALGKAITLRRVDPLTIEQRLAMLPTEDLPLDATLSIRWNRHQVPFVEAESDRDLAVGLGLVHAHLRLAQIELMRRIAEGRLSEFAGPAALEFDRVLRILDVDSAADAMVERLPAATRAWMDGFADGLNAYVAHLHGQGRKAWPEEFRLLGLAPEPWRPRDLMAIARLAATDFTWRVWLRLLKLRQREDWTQIWQRLMGSTLVPVPGFTGSGGALAGFDTLLAALSRQGSNSAAVAGSNTASGGAMIASDPHLGITLPNLWLIAGWRSPSYHAVGLMIPGVPVLALGRNRLVAWGGTSLHAQSSDLFALDREERAAIEERRERIKVRWWPDQEIVVRRSRHGPIISDSPLLLPRRRRDRAKGEALALRWIGHQPSDEVSAMLGVARSTRWDEFLQALESFAVPAQNMIYADAAGRVGQAMAARLPRRPLAPPGELLAGREALAQWETPVTAATLPRWDAPTQPFVASANNRPPASTVGGDVAVGHFFSPDDRVRRLRRLLGGPEKKTLQALALLQQDVFMDRGKFFAQRLLGLLPEPAAPLAQALSHWNGVYAADSPGALALELLACNLIVALHGDRATAVYAATWDAWALLAEDLEKTPPDRLRQALSQALGKAEPVFAELKTWGEAHRLQLNHFLGRAPVIGKRYRFGDLPSAGGNETLMKTAHGFAAGRHRVRYGANARHLSDLADPDQNHFVLLGGQDGWVGSSTFLDQLPLWRAGEYVQVPLTPSKVAELFTLVTTHRPRRAAA